MMTFHRFRLFSTSGIVKSSEEEAISPQLTYSPIQTTLSTKWPRDEVTPRWVRVGDTQWHAHNTIQLRFVHSVSKCLQQRRYQITVTFNSVEDYTLQDYFSVVAVCLKWKRRPGRVARSLAEKVIIKITPKSNTSCHILKHKASY